MEWFGEVDLGEANRLLDGNHYLGPERRGRAFGVKVHGELVAVQVFRNPSSRHIPLDVWELSRWCLTPAAGENAGSRMHSRAVKWVKQQNGVNALLSYSDPSVGHRGELYRACNWLWAPTWHRLRPPPSGLGSWDGVKRQEVKDRWVYPLRKRWDRSVFRAKDKAAVRRYLDSDEYSNITQRWPTLIPWDQQG